MPACRLSRNLYRTRSVKGWPCMALATPADLQASAAGRGLAACTDARCGQPRFGRQRGVRGAQLVVFGRGLGQMAIGEQVAARVEYARVTFFSTGVRFFRSPAPCRTGPTRQPTGSRTARVHPLRARRAGRRPHARRRARAVASRSLAYRRRAAAGLCQKWTRTRASQLHPARRAGHHRERSSGGECSACFGPSTCSISATGV